MSSAQDVLLELAAAIDPDLARAARCQLSHQQPGQAAYGALVLAATAYPVTAAHLEADAATLGGWMASASRQPWTVERYIAELAASWPAGDEEACGRALRTFARRQRLRIALREIVPREHGGEEFEATARELSDLAAATVEVALGEARRAVGERYGEPKRADGQESAFAVLGMGKLGGSELNAGSDIDLIFVYDTDDGETAPRGNAGGIPLHEFWSRVGRRLVSLLDEATADGFVWRVDLRLRPEGGRGPIVNSAAAMLRYYETWGRTWERAVLLRARAIAGDLELGGRVLADLDTFVFRRGVDPTVAAQLMDLVARARVELPLDLDRDVKHGVGGIRDLEMFVQALQLIWGGQHASLRVRNTLEALRRLRAGGFVTDREAATLDHSYVLLRRVEHFVQNATGVQTHAVPAGDTDRGRLARALGFASVEAFDRELALTRERVAGCVEGLSPSRPGPSRWAALLSALDAQDLPLVEQTVSAQGWTTTADFSKDLLLLARRPDDLLGSVTRERHAGHAEAVLDSLFESADPEQAAHYLRTFFQRRGVASVYASLLGNHQRAARRFITALGASRFLGEAIVSRTELADQVLFSKGMPSVEAARDAIGNELDATGEKPPYDLDAVAGAVRRARLRITTETALADLAGEVGVREVTQVLSSVAESSLETALRSACGSREPVEGICAIAVGKLGGFEMGYGSDLDLLFVFDPRAGGDEDEAIKVRARQAQRTIRALSAPHEAGAGYELDTRLRPSGSQGVLVTSIGSFARYHGLTEDGQRAPGVRGGAAAWERQTLVRARPCAGDAQLGQRVMRIAQLAAFECDEPDPIETHRLRMRMERELSGARGDRIDLKLGTGGLIDIEFAVQTLQMRHGKDVRVRVTGTAQAIDELQSCGYLAAERAAVLREGYEFLRKLEQRLHVVHAASIHLIEKNAPGLIPLARRMGLRDKAQRSAPEQLLSQTRAIMSAVRATYLEVLGVPG